MLCAHFVTSPVLDLTFAMYENSGIESFLSEVKYILLHFTLLAYPQILSCTLRFTVWEPHCNTPLQPIIGA